MDTSIGRSRHLLQVKMSLGSHLNGSSSPVLSVVVSIRSETSSLKSLLLGQTGEHAENDGGLGGDLGLHEALGNGVGNVLKVHGGALDEHADGDDSVVLVRVCHQVGDVGQLVRAGHRLDENVLSLDLEAAQRRDGSVEQSLDHLLVPSRVHNGDLEVGAVVNGVRSANTLNSTVGHFQLVQSAVCECVFWGW
jgi:hypothetical protein